MTADWTIPLEDSVAPAEGHAARTFGLMLSGRAQLTGAALHSPRTVHFTYGPGRTTFEDRWRLASGDQLLWIQEPDRVVTEFVAGRRRRVDRDFDGLLRQPAPEVVSLCSLAAAAGRLGVVAPGSPTREDSTAGRPTLTFEVEDPRRCQFVVDQETGFVLSVTAEGEHGPHSVVVGNFTVRPLQPEAFGPGESVN